jgi:hypothetical protein
MNYEVGAYNFNVPKPFKTNDEAVKFITERHPELSRDEIVEHLRPQIEHESDKLEKEHSESNSVGAQTDRKDRKRS